MSEQILDKLRLVLLARDSDASKQLRDTLVKADEVDVVQVSDPQKISVEHVLSANPQVVLVALEPAIENALDAFDPLFDNHAITVVFEEAEVVAKRSVWDTARWLRHLKAKLYRHDDVLPPGHESDDTPLASEKNQSSTSGDSAESESTVSSIQEESSTTQPLSVMQSESLQLAEMPLIDDEQPIQYQASTSSEPAVSDMSIDLSGTGEDGLDVDSAGVTTEPEVSTGGALDFDAEIQSLVDAGDTSSATGSATTEDTTLDDFFNDNVEFVAQDSDQSGAHTREDTLDFADYDFGRLDALSTDDASLDFEKETDAPQKAVAPVDTRSENTGLTDFAVAELHVSEDTQPQEDALDVSGFDFGRLDTLSSEAPVTGDEQSVEFALDLPIDPATETAAPSDTDDSYTFNADSFFKQVDRDVSAELFDGDYHALAGEKPAADEFAAFEAPKTAEPKTETVSAPTDDVFKDIDWGELSLVEETDEPSETPSVAVNAPPANPDSRMLDALEQRISSLSLVEIEEGPEEAEGAGEPIAPVATTQSPPAVQNDALSLHNAVAAQDTSSIQTPANPAFVASDPKLTSNTQSSSKTTAEPGKNGVVLLLGGLGGPDAVRQFLNILPGKFNETILIRLQLDGGRYDRLVRQMERISELPVVLAESGMTVKTGTVYFLTPETEFTQVGNEWQFVVDEAIVDINKLMLSLPAANAAILMLSGTDSSLVDIAYTRTMDDVLVAAQAPAGSYDASAANRLIDYDGEVAEPAALALRVLERWPSR